MEIREIAPEGARQAERADLESLIQDGEHPIWVDVPPGDAEAEHVLAELFGFHPLAVADSLRRNPAPKLHVYTDQAFLVLHAPELGENGHVHYIELDLFFCPRFLVSVHGPLNPLVDPALALVETSAVSRRIDQGRWRPGSPVELAHSIVTSMNQRMRHHVETLTLEIWRLEREVTAGTLGDPEKFLEDMFRVQHGLQAVRTMAALNREVFGRLGFLSVLGDDAAPLVADLVDQFGRVHALAAAQADYMEGVITLYQTRANTKMTVAAERLAVIAAVTLPVTAVSSVLGMNVIVNSDTRWVALAILLVSMGVMSLWLLFWARRQGWW